MQHPVIVVINVIAHVCMSCSSREQCLKQQALVSCIQLNASLCEILCTNHAVTQTTRQHGYQMHLL